MDKERFDKMEEMLSQVIYMVGNVKDRMESRLDNVEGRLGKIEDRLDKLDNRVDGLEKRLARVEMNQNKFQTDLQNTREEILTKLSEMQADQNFIWEKAARNERELAKIKAYLQI